MDMSDGSVECRQSHPAPTHVRGVGSLHVILAFFRGNNNNNININSNNNNSNNNRNNENNKNNKNTENTKNNKKDLSSFLNARRFSGLYFEDVVSLVIAHGLLPPGHMPESLYVVLADLSEHVFAEGQLVAW